MKKSKRKKTARKIILFIKAIIRLIDKKIITPITKFILLIEELKPKRELLLDEELEEEQSVADNNEKK